MAKPGRFRRVMTALNKLIADKEDTKQVFVILEAMAGNSGLRSWRRFKKAATAKAILSADRPLMAHLMDREALGGRWDGDARKWYITDDMDDAPFAQWMQDGVSEDRPEPRKATDNADAPSPSEGERIYLNCPFDEKEECKALGGRWDGDVKKWYVPQGVDTAPFAKWL